MRTVDLPRRNADEYEAIVGPETVAALRASASDLRGLRVLHVNSTERGGGVAELLRSSVPLLRDLGIDAEWRVISAVPEFFEVTKRIHNGLQGAEIELSDHEHLLWTECQALNARELADGWDVVVVHDPQPLGLAAELGDASPATRWIWRLHIDSSNLHPSVWALLRPWTQPYAAVVVSLPEFAPGDLPRHAVQVIPPAIDPLLVKNRPMAVGEARQAIGRLGIDARRPFLAQVSRLDPWKDPIGVIEAFRSVRADHPGAQLALLGAIEAADDPEALRMATEVRAAAGGDPDIHVITDPRTIGPVEVGAVQLLADVVLQKSLREGFGLTVAEALWKATPVVGGRAGGIVLQIEDAVSGFLVDSAEEAAGRCSWLLAHPSEARTMGAAGRSRVRERFLVTRLLADELSLYAEVMSATGTADLRPGVPLDPALDAGEPAEPATPVEGAP
jgi:trehalose synthase